MMGYNIFVSLCGENRPDPVELDRQFFISRIQKCYLNITFTILKFIVCIYS